MVLVPAQGCPEVNNTKFTVVLAAAAERDFIHSYKSQDRLESRIVGAAWRGRRRCDYPASWRAQKLGSLWNQNLDSILKDVTRYVHARSCIKMGVLEENQGHRQNIHVLYSLCNTDMHEVVVSEKVTPVFHIPTQNPDSIFDPHAMPLNPAPPHPNKPPPYPDPLTSFRCVTFP